MRIQYLTCATGEPASHVDAPTLKADGTWLWIDVQLEQPDNGKDLAVALEGLGFDELSVEDAAADLDHPKIDDFETSVLIVFHGLADNGLGTYQIHCFLNSTTLVTVHRTASPSLSTFADLVCRSSELAAGGPDQLLSRLADVLSRRFLVILDLLDDRVEELTDMALDAHPNFLEEVTFLRSEIREIRTVLRPQREVADQLRRTSSSLVGESAQRRFSDVYDTAARSVSEYETARTAIAEALAAYQSAEARKANEVSRVLTIYAAIMLPLALIAGIFGMNFSDLPWADRSDGWIWATGTMALVAIASLVVFVLIGWIRPFRKTRSLPSTTGLASESKTPVVIDDVLFKAPASGWRHGVRRRRPRQP